MQDPIFLPVLYCQFCFQTLEIRERGKFRSEVRVPFPSLLELSGGIPKPCGALGEGHSTRQWWARTPGLVVLRPAAATCDAPPSCSSHTCALWRALAVEPSLTTQVLGLLLEKMSRDVPFKESRTFLLGSTPDRVATLLPLAVSRSSWGHLIHCPCPPTGGLGALKAPGSCARARVP